MKASGGWRGGLLCVAARLLGERLGGLRGLLVAAAWRGCSRGLVFSGVGCGGGCWRQRAGLFPEGQRCCGWLGGGFGGAFPSWLVLGGLADVRAARGGGWLGGGFKGCFSQLAGTQQVGGGGGCALELCLACCVCEAAVVTWA